jgi:hypothetical protein
VLAVDTFLPPPHTGGFAAVFKFLQDVGHESVPFVLRKLAANAGRSESQSANLQTNALASPPICKLANSHRRCAAIPIAISVDDAVGQD